MGYRATASVRWVALEMRGSVAQLALLHVMFPDQLGRGKSLRTLDITSNRDIAIEAELLFQLMAVIGEDNQL